MRCTRRSSSTASSRPPSAARGPSPQQLDVQAACARARRRSRRRAARSRPGRELTTRSRRWPRNSSPTPSSSAQPPGSVPSRTRRQPHGQALGLAVGVHGERALEQAEAVDRLGRPAGARDAAPGTSTSRRRSARRARCRAATPARAARRARGPATSPAGCASSRRPRRRCPARARSPRAGAWRRAGGTARACSGTHARSAKRALKALICAVVSPEAVGRNRMRGSSTSASDSTKSSSSGLAGSIVKPPPPIAKISRARPATARSLLTLRRAPRALSAGGSRAAACAPAAAPAARARRALAAAPAEPEDSDLQAGLAHALAVVARPGRRAPCGRELTTRSRLGAAEVQRDAVLDGEPGAHAVARRSGGTRRGARARRRSARSWSRAAGPARARSAARRGRR